MDTSPARRWVDQKHPPITYHSLTVPARLLTDLSDSPLAIGLYGLVARLFLIEQKPIPLSTGDVQRYDPAISRSAVVRAFARLARSGWLIEQTTRGRKTCFTPGWGFVSGTARAWRIGATLLDRPRRTQVVLLNKRLFDTYIGKLVPHATNPALIERYLTQPLIGLADVGAYLLLDNGGPARPAERLAALGLIHDNHTAPLPSDEKLLARASQGALLDATQPIALTKKGLLKLGCRPADETRDVDTREQPLFFVSPSMFGSMIVDMDSNMTGPEPQNNTQNCASQCAQIRDVEPTAPITWIKGEQGNKGVTTPQPPAAEGGGGHTHSIQATNSSSHTSNSIALCKKAHHTSELPAESETARLLQALNVCPTVIAELADQPAERVQAAIADGKARPMVRDLGGWVVSLVRLGRDHGWKIQPPPARAGSSEALREAFAPYLAQQEDEPQVECEGDCLKLLPAVLRPAPETTLVQVWNAVQVALSAQTSRQEFNTWLRHARLHTLHDGVAVIAVPDRCVKDAIERRFLAGLRDQLTLFAGEPMVVRIIIEGTHRRVVGAGDRPGVLHSSSTIDRKAVLPSNTVADRPDWISAERWQALPVLVRAALCGARLVDRQVLGTTEHMTHLLQTRYAEQVAALIDSTAANVNSGG